MHDASICGRGSSLLVGFLLSLLIVSGLVVLNSIPTNIDAQSDQLGITKERHEYSSGHSKDNTDMKKLKQPKQTIVKFEDNAAGNAAGWNPDEPPTGTAREISLPFKIEQGMSFEITAMNPIGSPDQFGYVEAPNCDSVRFKPATNQIQTSCNAGFSEGATLTIIMTK